MNTQTNNGIEKVSTAGPLVVSRVFKNIYQKEGTLTAELRQAVETKTSYPSKQIANELQDNVFGADDFGFEKKTYSNTENRVSWIDVPANATQDQVVAKVATFQGANLYRILSNEPILSSSQMYAIGEGLTTKDAIAESQVVRFPENSENAGQLALDPNGKPQYRGVYFSAEGAEDIDNRTADEAFFATEKIKAEMATTTEQIVQGQEVKI